MNDDDLLRIEGLLAKATPGEWLLYPRPCGYLGDNRKSAEQLITYELGTDKPNWVAHFLLRADAQTAEALRNAAPAMIAELRRLRKVEAAARAFAGKCRECDGTGVVWEGPRGHLTQTCPACGALRAALESEG